MGHGTVMTAGFFQL